MTVTTIKKTEEVVKAKPTPKVSTRVTAIPATIKTIASKKVTAGKPVAKAISGKPAVAKAISGKYIETVGRRKTSTARVRVTESSKDGITINGKTLEVYFPTVELQSIVKDAIAKSKVATKFTVTVLVRGGGIHSQAEAVRHALARSLVKYDEETRTRLKKLGFLKRDPRMKERRKFGLKKARKAPQWSKR
ncbi:MAG: 30S ribosomal protein S9 [Parcubacteria group bacterium GW2011_GWA1_47_8]|nr:MAG: 30S ribosomal protein S9 [Parcubacteria group bacterium GW2011_GWA1_47_8]